LWRDGRTKLALSGLLSSEQANCLSSLIPGGRPLYGASPTHAGEDRGSMPLTRVLPVVWKNSAQQTGSKRRSAHCPVIPVGRRHSKKEVSKKLGFPADLLFVSCRNPMSAAAGIANWPSGPVDMSRASFSSKPPGRNLLPTVELHHDVGMIAREIGAVLAPRFQPRKVCASRSYENDDVSARGCARTRSTETRHDAALYEFSNRKWRVPAGERQHIGYQVERTEAKNRGRFVFTRVVLIKRLSRRPDTGGLTELPGNVPKSVKQPAAR